MANELHRFREMRTHRLVGHHAHRMPERGLAARQIDDILLQPTLLPDTRQHMTDPNHAPEIPASADSPNQNP